MTKIHSGLRYTILTSLWLALLFQPSGAHSQQPAPKASADTKSVAEKDFTDVMLVDQSGKETFVH